MDKKNTLKALTNFMDAYNQLIDNWGALNETEAINLYPFERSFDEYDVGGWVYETIKELGELKNE